MATNPDLPQIDFAALFERDLDACVLIDTRQSVLRINQGFTRLFGYTSTEAIGRSIDDLIVPREQRGEAQGFIKQVRLAGELSMDAVRCRKDGTCLQVWIVAQPHETVRGERIVYVQYRDLSEHKRAEDRLRASEAQLRAIFEQAPLGIIAVGADLIVLNVNGAFARMLGYTEEELRGTRLVDLVHPDEVAEAIQLRDRVLTGDRTIHAERRYRRKDGSYIWVRIAVSLTRDHTGEPLNFLGIIEDATEARTAAQRREAALTLFKSLIENMRDGIVVESLDRRITAVNTAFLKIFDVPGTAGELVGVDCRRAAAGVAAMVDPADDFITTIEQRIVDGKFACDTIHFCDGRVFERDYAPIHDPGGRVTGHLWEYNELTDVLKLQEQLRLAQKMEAIGRLAGGIAHDFNNLLTVLQGHASMLLEEPLPPTARADVEEILKASNKAANLTRQLLAYSRQQVLKPVVLDLGDVLRDLERTLLRIIGEDIVLDVVTAGDTPRVRADRTQLEQVILNLAVNARDAMPTGGKLRLSTERCTLAHERISRGVTIPPGTYAHLLVCDSGEGIEERLLPRIFDPFFTTKEQGKGTGLGLSTVYGIIKQSGGYILVESQSGHGCEFQIFLPEAKEAS